MKTYKRTTAMLLTLVFAISILIPALDAVPAYADTSGSCGTNVKYKLTGSVLTIYGNGPMNSYGRTGGGGSMLYPVASRYTSPFSCDSAFSPQIETVIIKEGVTTVGDYSFVGCKNLTNVTIADSIQSIKDNAFASCVSLTSVSVPASASIASNAFNYCSSLNSLTFTGDGSLTNSTRFSTKANIKTVILSDGIKDIGTNAFSGYSGLTEIIIPGSVTSFGQSAFSGCLSLTNITIPDGVTEIGQSSFSGCSGLTSISIPENVTTIGDSAFYQCKGLTNITIPDNVTILGKSAFSSCSGLSRATIGSGITDIGQSVFSGCIGLTSITIPNGVTSVGQSAFSGCTGLTSVTIPISVTRIGQSAFTNCKCLTYVTIPESVTSVGDAAFSGCENLADIAIPDSVTTIGNGAFDDTAWYNAQPDGVVYAGRIVYKYKGVMPEGYEIALKEGTWSITGAAFKDCAGLVGISIPNSVTSVGNSAFNGCTGLKSVIIPDGFKNIGASAFSGCTGLTSISIPASVTSIGNHAFDGCTGLSAVEIGNGVKSIGVAAFSGCKMLTSVMIPDSVTSIDSSAFSGCTGLTNLTIPDSVTSIGSKAFDGCTGLKRVTIPGNVTSIGTGAIPSTPIVYGDADSAAERFAKSNGNEFRLIGLQKYIVSFDANGGVDAPEPQEKEEGYSIELSTKQPTKVNTIAYDACGGSVSPENKQIKSTFSSWNTESDGSGTGYQAGGSYTTDADVTLYAQWKDPQAGTLAEPTRTGYSFDGWFTEANGGTKIISYTIVSRDITVYAHWTKIPDIYTIKYNANGGIDKPTSQSKTEGTPLTLSSTVPSKTFTVTFNANGGKVSVSSKTIKSAFDCWNTQEDGGGDAYQPGDLFITDADATLYAQWIDQTAGELPIPTRSHSSFDGWFTAVEGGNEVTAETVVSSNQTVYAHWTEIPLKTYSVNYDVNGGNGAPSAQVKTEEQALTLSSAKPTKLYTITYNAAGGEVSSASKSVSCAFSGWNTAADGKGASYQPGSKYTTDASVTFYAQWTDPAIGTLVTPTRSGYSFDGWYTTETGGTKVGPSSSITGNTTLYAHWTAKKTFTILYDANGGDGSPAAQKKIEGETLVLRSDKPTKSYTISYDANGGSVSPSSKSVSCTFNSWNTASDGTGTNYQPGGSYTADADATLYAQWKNPTAGELPAPKRTDYTFDGWYTAASGGSKVTSSTTISANTTVYAHWTEVPKQTYTVTYNANGGTGTPSSQTKIEGQTLTLSFAKPSKSYTISYNAAGGSVNPASKSVSCAFSGWNSKKDGSGTKYNPGGSYTADADVTLYAQWQNPTAGDLPTPQRSDYTFDGWYTAASGGSKVTSSSTISANTTVYARWASKPAANVYNLGDETYQFGNYGDSDSPGGHCFGMSMTSSAYYLGLLDMSRLGGSAGANLYSFSMTQKVKDPICLYQSIQGSYSSSAIVAGGSSYLSLFADIDSDWKSVVAYVKNHQYDNKGSLQIGFRKNGEGGHAINFLRYENVNGQDRIYAYDNNFPNAETYFYRDSSGRVLQAPTQTFSGAIDCIALRDVSKYFSVAKKFDSTHAVYVAKDCAKITGLTYTYMEGEIDGREYVMYEIPADMSKVKIVPSEDNADFIYLGTEYSFGEIEDDTYGVLKLQSMNEGAVIQEASFQIFSGSTESPTDPQPAALRGDANLDGKVLANDARLVLRASAKLETLEGQAFVNCDLNGDGKLLAGEARKILRYSAKLETEL